MKNADETVAFLVLEKL